jgi:hypothetical protein
VGGSHTDHDSIRVHEITNRPTLLEELGIRYDLHIVLCVGNEPLNLSVGAHGHGALQHDHEIVGRMLSKLLSNRENGAQIRLAIERRGCPDGDESEIHVANGRSEVG